MKIPFEIAKICGQSEAEDLCNRSPNYWNVVSIWSGGGGKHGSDFPALTSAKSVCSQRFHDIDRPACDNEGNPFILCEKDHIRDILKYAKTTYDQALISHCYAGISRSSAMMFLIFLDYFKGKTDWPVDIALDRLNEVKSWRLIYPNRHIIDIGIEVILENENDDNATLIKWRREFHNSDLFNRIYGRQLVQGGKSVF